MSMTLIVAASTSRRLVEIGFVIGGLGALVLMWAGYKTMSASGDTRRQRGVAMIAGGLLIGLSFLAQLVGLLTA